MATTAKKPRKAYAPRKQANEAGSSPKGMRREQKANALTYANYFASFGERYGDMSMQSITAAAQRAAERETGFSGSFTMNPYIQNQRVKRISSLPVDTTKDQLSKMLQSPDGSEQALRSAGNILEYTSYTMAKTRTTYQDLLTYHSYVYPAYAEEKDAKNSDFIREWRLAEKVKDEMQIERTARQIVGQCMRDGKVFYVPRIGVDKSHNNAQYAMLQQLPQDWTKIVGYNNVSKYTVAFNMFYFLQPGTVWTQFGSLFKPYIRDFLGIADQVKPAPKGVIYASYNPASLQNISQRMNGMNLPGNPELEYSQNGSWMYWVTLPVDKVFTFEADDVKVNVVSPFTGLYLSASQQAQMEQVQLEIVTNPLVAMVLGQMETYDSKEVLQSDAYKVSIPGRELFLAYFNQMMQNNNTGGIGFYPAPFKDMKMVQLNESPNANEISSRWNEYLVSKSGLAGIIPTSAEARAGIAQISLKIESRFAQHIYRQFERMMNVIYRKLRLKYEWRFKMFGSLAEDDALLKAAKDAMTLGILPDTAIYNALMGRSILDDISMSNAIVGCGVMDKRLPLISSFSARNPDAGLPPKGKTAVTEEDVLPDKGGRPKSEGITSEGQEADQDESVGE